MINSLWNEEFRPKKIEDYVGDVEFVSKVKHWIETNDVPNLLLYGPPGTGKTTAAKLIANSLDADILYINASDENGIDVIRDKIKMFVGTVGFGTWKIVICDEADYLSIHIAQPALWSIIENYSAHSRFILTCNHPERIYRALHSRLFAFHIQPTSRRDIGLRAKFILDTKEITYDPADIVSVVNEFYPDQRKIINFLQRCSLSGRLVLDKQGLVNQDYCSKILDELKTNSDMKSAFGNIRQIIADSKVRQFDNLFRYLYDNLDEFAPNGKKAQTILHIADCQHKIANVVDGEIQIAAMFINILKDLR